MEETLYCPAIILTKHCFTADFWAFFWSGVQAVILSTTTIAGALKIIHEIKLIKKNKEEENEFKRTEFFLNQHRRLFDDPNLSFILKFIDADDHELASPSNWDAKRKFITFFEEIELLIRSEKIDKNVAYYMFGYYANQAKDGNNFQAGINLEIKYWAVFFDFCDKSKEFLEQQDEESLKKIKY